MALSLVHANTEQELDQLEPLLEYSDLDLNNRENVKHLVMTIIEIAKAVARTREIQEHLIINLDALRKEVAKLKQQLYKQNQAKK